MSFRVESSLKEEGLNDEQRKRLERLKNEGAPKDLIGRVRAYVLRYHHGWEGDDKGSGPEGQESFVKKLGIEAAGSGAELQAIADLVTDTSRSEAGLQHKFGEGLADGAGDIAFVWNVLVKAFERNSENGHGNVKVLCGFLSGVFSRDQNAFNRLLDEAMERPVMRKRMPRLQASASLDTAGCDRLLLLLEDEAVAVTEFIALQGGGVTQGLSDEDIARLLRGLLRRDPGAEIALSVLRMHCFGSERQPGRFLRKVAIEVLENIGVEQWFDEGQRWALEGVAPLVLRGEDDESQSYARRVIWRVRRGVQSEGAGVRSLDGAIQTLFELQPDAALSVLIGEDTDKAAIERRQRLSGDGEKSVLLKIPSNVLLSWCRAGAETRWVHVAPLVQAFRVEEGKPAWSDQAQELLMNAPDGLKTEVAEGLASRIVEHPHGGWSGSLAEIFRGRIPLFEHLEAMLGPSHAECVARLRGQALERIRYEEERERARRQEEPRFE